MPRLHLLVLCASLVFACVATAAPGDEMLTRYFRAETAALSDRCLADVHTLSDWTSRREEYRRQLAEMLGLWPAPEKADLRPVITGTLDAPEYTVEKLQFQSRPGLYVTGDLYVPKHLDKPAPAILYACGHAQVKVDGVSYGNKTFYQHHGEWFARNGYVCLIFDTLQLGEIEGIHHGLYRERMWWWQSRGYTPAGVEAWNAIRAIDYLQSRKDVDPERIGMTGRSGGGAGTWYAAALDERIKVAVPVAGITDLQNYVVDGCIEGHCDCMFLTNTYRWDFPQVAALIAPRPLLIGNSDKDTLFPLDGVTRLHAKVREVYKLYNAADKLGLLITEGPHKDTQDLQVPAFRWFNRFLKNDAGDLKDATATADFPPKQLAVFPPHELPADQLNTKIQELFILVAPPPSVPASAEAWAEQRDRWMSELKAKTFGGWPDRAGPLDVRLVAEATGQGVRFQAFDFTSQPEIHLRLYVLRRAGDAAPSRLTLHVLNADEWPKWLASMRGRFAGALADEIAAYPGQPSDGPPLPNSDGLVCWIAPRGVGLSAWGGDEKKQTHIRRRFWLLGQTLDGMRVYDVRRAIAAARAAVNVDALPIRLTADGRSAGVALYAALFEPHVEALELSRLPTTDRDGPYLLNVEKTLGLPAAVAMAAERADVHLTAVDDPAVWQYPLDVARKLNWPAGRVQIDH